MSISENQIEKVIKWGKDKNILSDVPATSQAEKVKEEVKETYEAILNDGDIKDGVGDSMVTLILLSEMLNLNYFHQICKKAKNKDCYNPLDVTAEAIIDYSKKIKTCTALYDSYGVSDQKGRIQYLVIGLIAHLNNICDWFNHSMSECLEEAYDNIKDRKGQIVSKDGETTFVKKEDLETENYKYTEDLISDIRKDITGYTYNIIQLNSITYDNIVHFLDQQGLKKGDYSTSKDLKKDEDKIVSLFGLDVKINDELLINEYELLSEED